MDPSDPVPRSGFELVADDYEERALQLLRGAKDEILVVQFQIIDGGAVSGFLDELEAAFARGVEVSVLVDEEVMSSQFSIARLQEAGIPAAVDRGEVRTHTKLVVADGERALVGSTNWSDSAVARNRERDLWVEGGPIPGQLASYAHALIADPRSNANGSLLPGQHSQRPVVDRELEQSIQQTIGGATERVGVMLYGMRVYPDDPDSPSTVAAAALALAAERGVDVRVILEAGSNGVLREYNEQAEHFLESRGVPVRWEEPDRITHAKVLLADERALVGSANWGYGSFRRYHEASVLADDPQAVGPLWDDFESVWDIATEVHP